MMALFSLLAGAVVFFWLWGKIFSGAKDLVIDEAARKLQLPLSYKRREKIQCDFSEVTGVLLEKVAHQGKHRKTYTYAPTLLLGNKPPERLTDLRKARAESFTAWLCEKLGVAAE
jgi:hypothetical protein